MVTVVSFVLVLSQIVVFNLVVCTRTLVASVSNGDLSMDMYVTISRTKRAEDDPRPKDDFTEINRYVCPPSLCRLFDENTKEYKPRPRGTGGTIFYQGDIILDDKMTKVVYKDEIEKEGADEQAKSRRKRATMRPRKRLWKNGIVKYKFSKSITSRAKKAIQDAMKHIKERTCIQFEEKSKGDEDYIRFISEPGCWSQVGKVGGVQLVSLGAGCEALGTAVHEIVHALGVWHEQARPDRNRYIKVVKRNISPKFFPDFEPVDKVISSTRGYPYDYNSLMHYSSYAFTRNGRPTIEVIGRGEELGLRVGKRKALSSIDIGQIREMYRCNLKTTIKESRCEKGWKKRDLSCYKFFPTTKAQFAPAVSACQGLRSHIIAVTDKKEQRFLDKYLIRKFPEVLTWRTAGRRVNNKMVWYLGPGKYVNITYDNWAPQNPRSMSSTVLRREKNDTKWLWYGEWLGSYNQKPQYEHPYICEKKAKRRCLQGNYADGRDYRGKLDYTRDGYSCQKWTENYPKNHTLREEAMKAADKNTTSKDGLGDHNFCRNPSGLRRNRPWCYTTKKKIEWAYCDVSICVKSVEKFNERQRRRRERFGNKDQTVPSSLTKRVGVSHWSSSVRSKNGFQRDAENVQENTNTRQSKSFRNIRKDRKERRRKEREQIRRRKG